MSMVRQHRSTRILILVISASLILLLTYCERKKVSAGMDAENSFISDSAYIHAGNNLVKNTFDTLRASLLQQISSQGFDGAITFCSEQAYPITHAYADSVTIKRAALRYRNPNNMPDSIELIAFNLMVENLKSGKSPAEQLIRTASTGKIHFFKPIMLQSMCLNCHGTPGKEIQPSTLSRIQELYPADQAVDFKEGDLRGLWHIVFAASNK